MDIHSIQSVFGGSYAAGAQIRDGLVYVEPLFIHVIGMTCLISGVNTLLKNILELSMGVLDQYGATEINVLHR
jgi:ethanolamine transporter EutH